MPAQAQEGSRGGFQRLERQASEARGRSADRGAAAEQRGASEWRSRMQERQISRVERSAQQGPAGNGGWRSRRAGNGDAAVASRTDPSYRDTQQPSRRDRDRQQGQRWSRDASERGRVDRDRIEQDRARIGSGRESWRDRSHYNGNVYSNADRAGQRTWDNNWRRDRRYDWRSYRTSNRDVYRSSRYYAPYRAYSYRPLSVGLFVEPQFFGQRYWISDPWQYRLPAVYGPYKWVRYYDEVLLIDIYDGQVVDVIRDFFW